VFYLQVRQKTDVVSWKMEKGQVLFLASGLGEVLADLPSVQRAADETSPQLEQPVQAAWAIGSLKLGYDSGADRIVLVAEELSAPDDDEAGPGMARVALTREQALRIIENAKQLLRAGRPPCPMCGYPLGEDHACPRTNGHHAPSP